MSYDKMMFMTQCAIWGLKYDTALEWNMIPLWNRHISNRTQLTGCLVNWDVIGLENISLCTFEIKKKKQPVSHISTSQNFK